jgi:hypothetical protein
VEQAHTPSPGCAFWRASAQVWAIPVRCPCVPPHGMARTTGPAATADSSANATGHRWPWRNRSGLTLVVDAMLPARVQRLGLDFVLRIYSYIATPLTEGAFRRRSVGGAGCGARDCASHAQAREAPGPRPTDTTIRALGASWTTGARFAPGGKRGPGSVRRFRLPHQIAAMERREARALCAKRAPAPKGAD